jgi:hypothetical protein
VFIQQYTLIEGLLITLISIETEVNTRIDITKILAEVEENRETSRLVFNIYATNVTITSPLLQRVYKTETLPKLNNTL